MAVFQDIEHLAKFIEKVVIGHARHNQFAVFLMNSVPVNAFRVQKAIPFVNDLPQLLEVSYRIICEIIFSDTSRLYGEATEQQKYLYNSISHS